MITVWKFELIKKVFEEEYTVKMPIGATILRVGRQNHVACLWALVDSEMPTVERHFAIYGTGEPVRPEAKFLGGITMENNCVYLEWHVFELLL